MSVDKQLEKEIREACLFLREKNHSLPSETIQFMLDASLEKLKNSNRIKTYWFDCWDRNGKTSSIPIEALDTESAEIIFKNKYPDLGYDEPYN